MSVAEDFTVILEWARRRSLAGLGITNAEPVAPWATIRRFIESQGIEWSAGDWTSALRIAAEQFDRECKVLEYWRELLSLFLDELPEPQYTYSIRNHIIWLRRQQGKTLKEIGSEFHISPGRAAAIAKRVDARIALALRTFGRCSDPYAYDTWFHFGAGEERLLQ